jgi:hypothetical protein
MSNNCRGGPPWPPVLTPTASGEVGLILLGLKSSITES